MIFVLDWTTLRQCFDHPDLLIVEVEMSMVTLNSN